METACPQAGGAETTFSLSGQGAGRFKIKLYSAHSDIL